MTSTNAFELQQIRESAQGFAVSELRPHACDWDETESFDARIFPRMGEVGLLGITIPEEFGGVGLGAAHMAVAMEELAAAEPGATLSYLAHTLLFVHNLAQNGSAQQKSKYIPSCVAGQKIAGMAMTEPEAGSDAVGMKTKARRQDDRYILNGTKMFITNGPIGDYFLVYARTGEGREDLSTFVVERGFPGFRVGKKLSKMGMRSSPTSELIFENCEVPLENLVGTEGQSIRHMMRNLDIERVGLAAMSLGILRSCFETSLKYAQQRKQFATHIIYFQAVSEKIADMHVAYEAARALIEHAAAEVDSGRRANRSAATAKIYASEAATRVALDAIQVLGGYGYIREFPVERLMRDAKLLEIGGGTSEILRNVIVKELMGDAPGYDRDRRGG